MIVDPHTPVRDALQEFFQDFRLGDGGYDEKTFGLNILGLFSVPVPNTKGRRAAVKFHDIHHLLTGYEKNIAGESEIAAWEIASGCGRYRAAWVLNLGALSYGVFLWPRRVIRAFMRGAASRNLYHGTRYDNVLLGRTIEDLRTSFGVISEARHTPRHCGVYVLHAYFGCSCSNCARLMCSNHEISCMTLFSATN